MLIHEDITMKVSKESSWNRGTLQQNPSLIHLQREANHE